MGRLADVQAFLDRRPIVFCFSLVLFAFPILFVAIAVRPTIALAAQRQGLVFVVAYENIRVVVQWLADLYTNFYYVQMSSIGYFEGMGKKSIAGAFVILGTLLSLALGLVTMAINFGVAETLLRAVTPAYADPGLLVSIALTPTLVMSLYVPVYVQISNTLGILLGMLKRNFLLVFPAYGFGMASTVLGGVLMISFFTRSGCEEMIVAANASAALAGTAFNSETWVCPTAEAALLGASWIEVVTVAASAAGALITVFCIGKSRGYFAEHGRSLSKYLHAGKDDAVVAKMCSLHFACVNLRSILNNTRDLISPLVATRVGIVDAAVFNFFESVGTFSYSVPNICGSFLMTVGSGLIGAGRIDEFIRTVHFFEGFAVVCAVIFTGLAIVSRDLEIDSLFSNSVDEGVFLPVANRVWPAAIILQPFRALVGVYGPIIIACQGYVEWGTTVTICFFFVYLPLTIAGGAAGSVELLVWANVAYNVAHLICLVGLIHFRMIPRIKQRKLPFSDVLGLPSPDDKDKAADESSSTTSTASEAA